MEAGGAPSRGPPLRPRSPVMFAETPRAVLGFLYLILPLTLLVRSWRSHLTDEETAPEDVTCLLGARR